MSGETLAERTYLNIRSDMLNGELKPGDQLIFRTIAERHGVSLAPVREAVSRLAAEGLISYVPGAGSFVKRLTKKDLYELYVLREGLESTAAHEAAINAHPLQLQDLEELCNLFDHLLQQISDSPADSAVLNRWTDAEERYHQLILEASRNSLLIQFCQNHRMQFQIFESQRVKSLKLSRTLAEVTASFHRKIFEAIRNREAELARTLMIEHIRHGREDTLRQFSQFDDVN